MKELDAQVEQEQDDQDNLALKFGDVTCNNCPRQLSWWERGQWRNISCR